MLLISNGHFYFKFQVLVRINKETRIQMTKNAQEGIFISILKQKVSEELTKHKCSTVFIFMNKIVLVRM